MITAHFCKGNYLYIKTRASSGRHLLIINIEVNDLSESKDVEFQKSAFTFTTFFGQERIMLFCISVLFVKIKIVSKTVNVYRFEL